MDHSIGLPSGGPEGSIWSEEERVSVGGREEQQGTRKWGGVEEGGRYSDLFLTQLKADADPGSSSSL